MNKNVLMLIVACAISSSQVYGQTVEDENEQIAVHVPVQENTPEQTVTQSVDAKAMSDTPEMSELTPEEEKELEEMLIKFLQAQQDASESK